MDFADHTNFLTARMKRGDLVLVLGAGANGGSLNRHNRDILTGVGLSKRLCEEMGEAHSGESLAEVASAFEHTCGRDALNKILINEFRFTQPSTALKNLFSYTWKRVYTWNYDDAMIESAKDSVQRVSTYNGMHDLVEDIASPANLQIIYLHGMITQLDKRIILTNEDYADALQASDHAWYRKATQDYRASTVVFIGSSLNEPILAAELERAARSGVGNAGLAFVVTPENISRVRFASLAKRGIIHVNGSLEALTTWLNGLLGPDHPPKAIIESDKFFNEANIERFNLDDISAAQSIKPIERSSLYNRFENEGVQRQAAYARSFLNGFPPSWLLASSNIPVRLTQLADLKAALIAAAIDGIELFVTVGQAGSGKSTATMQALLDLTMDGKFDVFELSPDTKSVAKALDVLARISDKPKIVYLSNLFIFGTQLEDDFAAARRAGVTFVSTARSSEWKEHFERHFANNSRYFIFQRFVKDDYSPLIDRLKTYVPAPSFVKLKVDQQVERLARSKNQLLIALREATESRNFDDIIISEYKSLIDDDVRELFLIIGLATLARVGILPADASEAYNVRRRQRSFEDALDKLEGIVAPISNGRLIARHEFYVRNILDQAVSLKVTVQLICDMLHTFTKYSIPITRHVGRSDAALFRFLLNHGFLRERSERGGDKYAGLTVYSAFEVDFQLDGHFWLQYGLYYQRLGNSPVAIEMLEKSIQAFPLNPFAIHALASERLFQAGKRAAYDGESKRLIHLGVTELEKLDSNPLYAMDHYPLVTLSRYHIPVLLHHGQDIAARETARDYYERLRIMEKTITSSELIEAKTRLLKFVTSQVWEI